MSNPTGGTTPSGQPISTQTIANTGGQSGSATLIPGGNGQSGVSTTLPGNVSLEVSGSTGSQAPSGAVTDIAATLQTLNPGAGGQSQANAVQDFAAGLPAGTLLDVRTLTPTVSAGAAPTDPIVISGGAAAGGGSQEAFVVDTRFLPAGSVLQLDNIEFAAITGAATIRGGGGANYLVADDNFQSITLGADDDTLSGGGGDDTIGSLGGNDIIYGNKGNDFISGGADNDSLFGGQGNDSIYGNFNDDELYGNLASDTMFGGQGTDTLFGGQESDVLFGNLGDDALFGNRDSDLLIGGRGTDTLHGGDGADVFRFGLGDGLDQVSDFSIAEGDRIQVLIEGSTVTSLAGLGSFLTSDAAGNLVVNLEDGSGLTLVGVSTAQVSSIQVELVSGDAVVASGTLSGAALQQRSSASVKSDDASTRAEDVSTMTGYLAPGEWLF